MIGKILILGTVFLATAPSQSAPTPNVRRDVEDLEDLFRELLVLQRMDLRWNLGIQSSGWKITASVSPDYQLVFPSPEGVTEEQLAAAGGAVAAAPMSAQARLDYAELLRRTRIRRDSSVHMTRGAVAAEAQEQLVLAERLLSDRVGDGADEDAVLTYAKVLHALGRSLEARRLMVGLADGDRRSWRACLELARLSNAFADEQLVRLPRLLTLGVIPRRSSEGEDYLRRALEYAPGDEAVRDRVNAVRMDRGFRDIMQASLGGDLRALTVAADNLREIIAGSDTLNGDSPVEIEWVRRLLLKRLVRSMLDLDNIWALKSIAPPTSTTDVETILRRFFGAPSAGELAYYERVDRAMLALDGERGAVGEGGLIRVITAVLRCDVALVATRIEALRAADEEIDEWTRFAVGMIPPEIRTMPVFAMFGERGLPDESTLSVAARAHEAYFAGDFARARREFEAIVVRRPESKIGRLGVALTSLLDPTSRALPAQVRRLLLAIAEPGDRDSGQRSSRALAHAGLALLAVRAEDLSTAVQRMRVATWCNPSHELLRLRAAVEHNATQRLRESSPERAGMCLSALQSLVHAVEAATQSGGAISQEEQLHHTDRIRAWVSVGLGWLAEDCSGLAPGSRMRFEARLLRAGLAVGGNDGTLAAWNERLLDNLVRRHADGDLGDGEKLALVRAAMLVASRAEDASRKSKVLEHAVLVATELTSGSGGLDPGAALWLAYALANSGRDQDAESVLEGAIATAKSKLGGSRLSMLGDLELMLVKLRVKHISDPAIAQALREWCEPIVQSPLRPLASLVILACIRMESGAPSGLAEAGALLARARGAEEREPVLWFLRSYVAAAENRSADARSALATALGHLRNHGWGEVGWLAPPLLRELASPGRPGGWAAILRDAVGVEGMRKLTGR